MSQIQRSYHCKTVDMLISSATILDSAVIHQTEIIKRRPTWAPPFFENFRGEIDSVIKVYLGIDGAKGLREATSVLMKMQAASLKELGDLKMEITEDFKKDKPRRDEILKQLGFDTYLADARKGDQEALINLLTQCNTNLTPALIHEITAAGIHISLINSINAHADAFPQANISQEGFKGNRKSATAEATKAFNDIYDRVISICKIVSRYFPDQPDVRSKFSFSKVSGALNTTPKKAKDKESKT